MAGRTASGWLAFLALLLLSSILPSSAVAQVPSDRAGVSSLLDSATLYPAALALQHAEHLGLSEAQQVRLTEIQAEWLERTAEARAHLEAERSTRREARAERREAMQEAHREAMAERRQRMQERMRERSDTLEAGALREGMRGMDREEMRTRMQQMDRDRLREDRPGMGPVRMRAVMRQEMQRARSGPGAWEGSRMRGGSEAMSPETREARAVLVDAHREGMEAIRETLSEEQVRQLRTLQAVDRPRMRGFGGMRGSDARGAAMHGTSMRGAPTPQAAARATARLGFTPRHFLDLEARRPGLLWRNTLPSDRGPERRIR